MTKRLFPIAIAVAVAILPAAAIAQTSGSTFTGPHAGVSGGWNQGQDRRTIGSAPRTDTKRSGVVMRGFVGYDLPVGEQVVIGGEIGIATGGKDIITRRSAGTFRTDPGIALDATARVGFKPTDNLLLFAKGGWAYQRVKTDGLIGGQRLLGKGNEHGILFGGGMEVAVAPNVALRAEYDRVSFNENYKRDRVLAGLSFGF